MHCDLRQVRWAAATALRVLQCGAAEEAGKAAGAHLVCVGVVLLGQLVVSLLYILVI